MPINKYKNEGKSTFAIIIALLVAVLIAAIIFAPRQDEESVFDADPIVAYAHGEVLWEDGINQPDMEYLLAVQNHYVLKYQKQLDSNAAKAQRLKKTIDGMVADEVIANGLYLDWLIQQADSKQKSTDLATVSTVRWYYISHFKKAPESTGHNDYRAFGITADIGDALKFDGLNIFEATSSSKSDYIDDCVAAGVPVPDTLFDDRDGKWTNSGFLENPMLGPGNSTNPVTGSELWMYRSEEPTGMCLAFRRFYGGEPPTGHFDLICLGVESNNACFFETKVSDEGADTETNLDGPVDIASILPGEDIPTARACTTCHIGENPFLVHPEDQAFVQALAAKSGIGNPMTWSGTDFFHAFGVPDWPENPPPLNLSNIFSENRCSDCHQNLWGGRFPDITQTDDPTTYSSYCSTVLGGALGMNSDPATMPMGDTNAPGYDLHKAYLLAMCDQPDEGVLVDNTFDDDPSVVSPPHIVVPLYQCAKAVFVEDYFDGAQVELRINSNVVDTMNPANGPGAIEFASFGQLEEGDIVQARQNEGGVWSEWTREISVSNHKDVYPDGLPTPTIDPSTVYACSGVVAVRYAIPGFDVEVSVNGADPVSGLTYAGHKPMKPGKTPFELGDEFTAQVSACGDMSPISDAVLAQRPSSDTLTDAQIDPVSMYEGQMFINIGNLTYGSASEVLKAGGGLEGVFSTPMPWMNFRLANPLVPSDQLAVAQELCSFSSQASFAQSPPVLDCSVLPAPVIKDPLPGQDFVSVIEPLLGSRVRVYDEDGNELGDGTGNVIVLTRALIDEESVNVTQQIGECISTVAFFIKV